MIFTDEGGRKYQFEIQYDLYYKEISIAIIMNSKWIQVIRKSCICDNTAGWKTYSSPYGFSEDFRQHLIKLLQDEYLQLL
jgi:hypothetical protein